MDTNKKIGGELIDFMERSVWIEGELYSSKNGRVIVRTARRPFLVKDTKAKQQERDLAIQLRAKRVAWVKAVEQANAQRMEDQGLPANVDVQTTQDPSLALRAPLKVLFTITRRTHGRFDYTNIIQNLTDSMVDAGWLVDDSADYLLPVFAPYLVDPKNPGVLISPLP